MVVTHTLGGEASCCQSLFSRAVLMAALGSEGAGIHRIFTVSNGNCSTYYVPPLTPTV